MPTPLLHRYKHGIKPHCCWGPGIANYNNCLLCGMIALLQTLTPCKLSIGSRQLTKLMTIALSCYISFCLFADFTMTHGQNVNMTCNYSTPYSIPESADFYLYDGINLTMTTYYEVAPGRSLDSVQITRPPPDASTSLFNGFFILGTPGCQNLWVGRCTHTFDQDDTCDPCEFSVTLVAYNPSSDDDEYRSVLTTSSGTDSCRIFLEGNNQFVLSSNNVKFCLKI